MKRNTCFNYKMHDSVLDYGYGALVIDWAYEVVRTEGVHYHCWIPRNINLDERITLLDEFTEAATKKGDPISFSWDYRPIENKKNRGQNVTKPIPPHGMCDLRNKSL